MYIQSVGHCVKHNFLSGTEYYSFTHILLVKAYNMITLAKERELQCSSLAVNHGMNCKIVWTIAGRVTYILLSCYEMRYDASVWQKNCSVTCILLLDRQMRQHGRKTAVLALTPCSPWNKLCYGYLRGRAQHHLQISVGPGTREMRLPSRRCCIIEHSLPVANGWNLRQNAVAVVSLTVCCHWMRTVWQKTTVDLTPCLSLDKMRWGYLAEMCSATYCLLARWYMRVPHAQQAASLTC